MSQTPQTAFEPSTARRLVADERGASLSQYVLVCALVGLGAVGGYELLRDDKASALTTLGCSLQGHVLGTGTSHCAAAAEDARSGWDDAKVDTTGDGAGGPPAEFASATVRQVYGSTRDGLAELDALQRRRGGGFDLAGEGLDLAGFGETQSASASVFTGDDFQVAYSLTPGALVNDPLRDLLDERAQQQAREDAERRARQQARTPRKPPSRPPARGPGLGGPMGRLGAAGAAVAAGLMVKNAVDDAIAPQLNLALPGGDRVVFDWRLGGVGTLSLEEDGSWSDHAALVTLGAGQLEARLVRGRTLVATSPLPGDDWTLQPEGIATLSEGIARALRSEDAPDGEGDEPPLLLPPPRREYETLEDGREVVYEIDAFGIRRMVFSTRPARRHEARNRVLSDRPLVAPITEYMFASWVPPEADQEHTIDYWFREVSRLRVAGGTEFHGEEEDWNPAGTLVEKMGEYGLLTHVSQDGRVHWTGIDADALRAGQQAMASRNPGAPFTPLREGVPHPLQEEFAFLKNMVGEDKIVLTPWRSPRDFDAKADFLPAQDGTVRIFWNDVKQAMEGRHVGLLQRLTTLAVHQPTDRALERTTVDQLWVRKDRNVRAVSDRLAHHSMADFLALNGQLAARETAGSRRAREAAAAPFNKMGKGHREAALDEEAEVFRRLEGARPIAQPGTSIREVEGSSGVFEIVTQGQAPISSIAEDTLFAGAELHEVLPIHPEGEVVGEARIREIGGRSEIEATFRHGPDRISISLTFLETGHAPIEMFHALQNALRDGYDTLMPGGEGMPSGGEGGVDPYRGDEELDEAG